MSTEPWTPTAALVASNTAANLLAQVSGTVTANIGTGSIAAGTNAIGDVGLQFRANATGAASTAKLIAAAGNNPTVVKASAGRIVGYHLTNTAAAVRFVKLHNTTSARASEDAGERPAVIRASRPQSINTARPANRGGRR